MKDQHIVCISPGISPNVLAILKGFIDYGVLYKFVTSFAYVPSCAVETIGNNLPALNRFLRKTVYRRAAPSFLKKNQIEMYGWREIIRILAGRFLDKISSDKVWEWAERGFDRSVASRWAGQVPFLYGFELASVETFRRHKARQGVCILNQLIGHHKIWYKLFQMEIEHFPDAATDYDHWIFKTASRINAMKDEQYALSDLIIANSDFARETFIASGISPNKIVVVPTAGPVPPLINESKRLQNRVVFLSAGSQSIRKGTHYLIEAWKKAGLSSDKAELWMIGSNLLPVRMITSLPQTVVMRSALPRHELFEIYQQASVLVLPTLFEGFAYVILEAMAHGLPVITTPNSGCGSFVENGKNGWVVPPQDVDKLADRIVWCADHPNELARMGAESRQKALKWTWDNYSAKHSETVLAFMQQNT